MHHILVLRSAFVNDARPTMTTTNKAANSMVPVVLFDDSKYEKTSAAAEVPLTKTVSSEKPLRHAKVANAAHNTAMPILTNTGME